MPTEFVVHPVSQYTQTALFKDAKRNHWHCSFLLLVAMASTLVAMASSLLAMASTVFHRSSDGLHPSGHGLQPTSNGLHRIPP